MPDFFLSCQAQMQIYFSTYDGKINVASPVIDVQQGFDYAMLDYLARIGFKDISRQQCKVLQYKTKIGRKSRSIAPCIIFYLLPSKNNDQLIIKLTQAKKLMKIGNQDPFIEKIKKKDYAGLHFISEQGDPIQIVK